MANGRQDVVQAMALADVVPDVIGSHEAQSQLIGQLDQLAVALGISEGQRLLQLEKEILRPEPLDVAASSRGRALVATSGDERRHLAVLVSRERDQTVG